MEEEKIGKLTEEELEAGIRIYGERIEEIEKVLKGKVIYSPEKERYERKLINLKNKKGLFFTLYRKYIEYKLKTNQEISGKLDERSRKVLEEKLEKYKKRVADFYKTKSFRNYEVK